MYAALQVASPFVIKLTWHKAPPDARGLLVGQHGTWIVAGYAIAGWVGAGTYYSSNLSFQWRFPIALSIVPPLALALCAKWIPESPRWCEY
jgi:MFS family permease